LLNQQYFPPKGKEWIDKTLLCLKQSLVQFTTQSKESKTCQNIYNAAFDSHPNCYVQSGFCDLFLQPEVGLTIQALLKTYEVKDFTSFISIKQILETTKLCGADVIKKIWEIIKGLKHDFSEDFSDWMKFLN
jgi:hypothetical protein